MSYDQFTRNASQVGPNVTGSGAGGTYGTAKSPLGPPEAHGRIRESSSGALVGKNIAGLSQIGKSSSSNLKEGGKFATYKNSEAVHEYS